MIVQTNLKIMHILFNSIFVPDSSNAKFVETFAPNMTMPKDVVSYKISSI